MGDQDTDDGNKVPVVACRRSGVSCGARPSGLLLEAADTITLKRAPTQRLPRLATVNGPFALGRLRIATAWTP